MITESDCTKMIANKTCLGSIPSDGTSKSFRFIDREFGDTPGTLEYTVQFVYRNMTVSDESNVMTHYNRSYTPPAFITGDFFGVARQLRRGAFF